MAFLLDTNVLSELRKAHRANANVCSWQAKHPVSKQWVSVISLMEVKIGIVRAWSQDKNFARVLDEWYRKRLVPAFAGRTLAVDLKTAEKRAGYEKQRTIAYSDALIAATAAVHDMTIVTRNTADFADLGIKLVNPWEHPLDESC